MGHHRLPGRAGLLLAGTLLASPAGAQEPRLFDRNDVLALHITADLKGLMNERDSTKLADFPARLGYAGPGGEVVDVDAALKLRGHWRRQRKNCEFAPIKVDFPKGARAGTVFEDQGDLKLVTHCRRSDEYEQYVLRESLVYSLYNILTPVSLRARLARVTYRETAGKQDSVTRFAFFIENEGKAAARLGAEVLEIKGARWPDVDPAQANLVSLFQYLVGATDWSLIALHNIVLFQHKETGTIWPMAYDFDWTGIANTRYSFPDYRLPIKSVRERLYRGVCRTPEEWAPTIALFQDKKAELYAVYDGQPDLDPKYVKQTKEYLDDFYKVLDDPRRFRQEIIDSCK